MSVKSIAALKPNPMANSLLQNNGEARADIIRNTSATVAWVVGYVNGGDTLDSDTDNTAPRSPMHGLRGHTHTGGDDGKALFRTVASVTFDDHQTLSANVERQLIVPITAEWEPRPASSPVSPPAYDPGDGTGKYVPIGPLVPIWVPGCDARQGCFLQMGWRAHIDVRANTNVAAGDVLTMRISNLTTDAFAEDTTSGLNTSGWNSSLNSDADSKRISCLPGQWNVFQLSGELVADATAGTRDLIVALTALELGVYET